MSKNRWLIILFTSCFVNFSGAYAQDSAGTKADQTLHRALFAMRYQASSNGRTASISKCRCG